MTRQGPAARIVAHSGPPRWKATRHGWASTARMIGLGAHRSHSTRVFPQPARANLRPNRIIEVGCALAPGFRNAGRFPPAQTPIAIAPRLYQAVEGLAQKGTVTKTVPDEQEI